MSLFPAGRLQKDIGNPQRPGKLVKKSSHCSNTDNCMPSFSPALLRKVLLLKLEFEHSYTLKFRKLGSTAIRLLLKCTGLCKSWIWHWIVFAGGACFKQRQRSQCVIVIFTLCLVTLFAGQWAYKFNHIFPPLHPPPWGRDDSKKSVCYCLFPWASHGDLKTIYCSYSEPTADKASITDL